MSELPTLFIGSSVEGLQLAEELHALLQHDWDVQVWHQGMFVAGEYTLESLLNEADKFDFALMVFSGDDNVESRNATYNAPRDNILFEMGLFVGLLGRERTFMLVEIGSALKIPSDLAGITKIDFRRNELEPAAWLGPARVQLQRVFRKLGKREPTTTRVPGPRPPVITPDEVLKQRVSLHSGIMGVNAPRVSLASWHETIVPVLRQSTYYTAPTYYLDAALSIVGWNIAFELLFEEIAHKILYLHVNNFIARLENHEDVFRHGHEFTEKANTGELPYTDDELLVYRSIRFGEIKLQKVATQLHGTDGADKGWSATLYIKQIDWPLFERHLGERIWQDKLWGVYASAYDKVLKDYPPYQKLLTDVCAAIPDGGTNVIDIGAGTGNSSEVLLNRGFSVTSLESSAEMIDRMRLKEFDNARHTIVKGRAEYVADIFGEKDKFDGATAVNVLYSVDNPYQCLCGIRDILKPDAMLGLSTTHADITLGPLLDDIEEHLRTTGAIDDLLPEYNLIRETNENIERRIAKRTSAKKYAELLGDAGFDIVRMEEHTYNGAVMLVHARRR